MYVNSKLELPKHVTLPEDEKLLEAKEKNDMITILADIDTNKGRIWELKKQLADIDDELDNLKKINVEIDEIIKVKQELKKVD